MSALPCGCDPGCRVYCPVLQGQLDAIHPVSRDTVHIVAAAAVAMDAIADHMNAVMDAAGYPPMPAVSA